MPLTRRHLRSCRRPQYEVCSRQERRELGLLDATSGERCAGPPEDKDVVRDPRSLSRIRHRCWTRSTEGSLLDILGDEGLILPTPLAWHLWRL